METYIKIAQALINEKRAGWFSKPKSNHSIQTSPPATQAEMDEQVVNSMTPEQYFWYANQQSKELRKGMNTKEMNNRGQELYPGNYPPTVNNQQNNNSSAVHTGTMQQQEAPIRESTFLRSPIDWLNRFLNYGKPYNPNIQQQELRNQHMRTHQR